MISLGFQRCQLIRQVTPSVSSLLSRSASSAGASVARFKNVSFAHNPAAGDQLTEVSFSIRGGSKVTIMGQNGAGKSTIIKLLSNSLRPDEGDVSISAGERVACAMQTMPQDCREMTIKSFFASMLTQSARLESHELEKKIAMVLKEVMLDAPGDRIVKSFSGGQQARLLLAAALIQEPTILLLDEPTNNLDHEGLWQLQCMIQMTDKTVVVISHDEEFLNSFTDAVLYLDIHSKKVEVYAGDYGDVKAEIAKRIKRENASNAQKMKVAQAKKDQANKFANKGGGMRKVAKTMRSVAAKMEEDIVSVRREDIALGNFDVPFTPRSLTGKLMEIGEVSSYNRTASIQSGPVELRKGSRVQVCGPNGIGKTTFLEQIAAGTAPGVTISDGVSVGYYRQDFHNFDFEATVFAALEKTSALSHTERELRSIAAKFLLHEGTMSQPIKTLSEGQKALLSLACLYIQKPSLLIFDEPTNHVNFRHLPALANALRNFEGAVLFVSHDAHFVEEVGSLDHVIDMGKVLLDAKSPTKETPQKKKKKQQFSK